MKSCGGESPGGRTDSEKQPWHESFVCCIPWHREKRRDIPPQEVECDLQVSFVFAWFLLTSPRSLLGVSIERWLMQGQTFVSKGQIAYLRFVLWASLLMRPSSAVPLPWTLYVLFWTAVWPSDLRVTCSFITANMLWTVKNAACPSTTNWTGFCGWWDHSLGRTPSNLSAAAS